MLRLGAEHETKGGAACVLGTPTIQMMTGLKPVNRPMTSRIGSRSTAPRPTPPTWNRGPLAEMGHSNQDEELRMQRQVKAKSLSVKIPKNEPTTVRLNCVLANEEFLTLEIPRYALERFIVQAKRAIEEAPLLSRRRSRG
jgi:hypothetical protein